MPPVISAGGECEKTSIYDEIERRAGGGRQDSASFSTDMCAYIAGATICLQKMQLGYVIVHVIGHNEQIHLGAHLVLGMWMHDLRVMSVGQRN